MLPDINTTPNLIVTRTFSKAYGLAFLRIGMIAGPAPLMDHVRKVSSPYNVNGVALACLPAALADEPYLDWYVAEVERNRTELMHGLDALGVPYFPSAANFLLMQIGPQHAALVTAARARGILLRDRSSDPGCEGYVRITIGPLDHAKRGLQALTQALTDINWTQRS